MPRKKATSKRANNEGSVYKNKRGQPCPLSSQKRRPQTVDTTEYVSPKSYAILVDEVQKANNRAAHI